MKKRMNKNGFSDPRTIAFVFVVTFLLLLGGLFGALELSLFDDVDIEEEEVDIFIKQHEEKIVEYLQLSKFPHTTGDNVEIYELYADETPKLAIEIDWKKKTIDILNETKQHDYNLRIEVPEKLYWRGIREFKTAVREGKSMESGTTFLNIFFETEIDIPGEWWGSEQTYRWKFARWANKEHKRIDQDYDRIGKALEGELGITQVIRWNLKKAITAGS